jgi:Domain of unknown function (DUF4291)
MKLPTEPYSQQLRRWPAAGQHILAHYDTQSVIVYQAYRPAIAEYAAAHGYFGGEFSFSRMSWIKPNFLWMMYRSGWASKPDQERVLALRLPRSLFENLLSEAVPSSHAAAPDLTREAWAQAVKSSDVRLQWDPDHAPSGAKEVRRALQLGLRGSALRRFSDGLEGVEDITAFVHEQRALVDDFEKLHFPLERVYPVPDAAMVARIGLDSL